MLLVKRQDLTWEDTEKFYWKYNPTQSCKQKCQLCRKLMRLIPFNMLPACRRLLFPLLHACNKGNRRRLHAGNLICGAPRKFWISYSCIRFQYHKIFISRQNKLVCAQKASERITTFVPRWFHLLVDCKTVVFFFFFFFLKISKECCNKLLVLFFVIVEQLILPCK